MPFHLELVNGGVGSPGICRACGNALLQGRPELGVLHLSSRQEFITYDRGRRRRNPFYDVAKDREKLPII
jgi:hypothetical protein